MSQTLCKLNHISILIEIYTMFCREYFTYLNTVSNFNDLSENNLSESRNTKIGYIFKKWFLRKNIRIYKRRSLTFRVHQTKIDTKWNVVSLTKHNHFYPIFLSRKIFFLFFSRQIKFQPRKKESSHFLKRKIKTFEFFESKKYLKIRAKWAEKRFKSPGSAMSAIDRCKILPLYSILWKLDKSSNGKFLKHQKSKFWHFSSVIHGYSFRILV